MSTGKKRKREEGNEETDGEVPDEFCCSITHQVMVDPVCTKDGHCYDRESITEWFRRRQPPTSPKTGLVLTSTELIPIHNLRQAIQRWRKAEQERKEAEEKRKREDAAVIMASLFQRRLMHPATVRALQIQRQAVLATEKASAAQDALREAEAAVAKAREDIERAEREQVEAVAAVGNAFAVIEEKKWARVCEDDILKMLPTDASDKLKKGIGDLVHNRVKVLDLDSDKNTSDEGAKALAEALKVNTALQVLYLNHNKISDEGAKALAEALKVNTALQKLGLCGNKISDEGAKALAEALKDRKSVV